MSAVSAKRRRAAGKRPSADGVMWAKIAVETLRILTNNIGKSSMLAPYLATLGLPTGKVPTPDQLRTAWRATARRVHPDRGGTVAAFTRAVEARKVIQTFSDVVAGATAATKQPAMPHAETHAYATQGAVDYARQSAAILAEEKTKQEIEKTRQEAEKTKQEQIRAGRTPRATGGSETPRPSGLAGWFVDRDMAEVVALTLVALAAIGYLCSALCALARNLLMPRP